MIHPYHEKELLLFNAKKIKAMLLLVIIFLLILETNTEIF